MRASNVGGGGFKWVYRIADTYPWLESVADLCADIAILVDQEDALPNQYFWSSPHLQDLTSVQEVEDRNFELKAMFDAALDIHTVGYHPLTLQDLAEWRGGNAVDRPRPEPRIGFSPFADSVIENKKQWDPRELDWLGVSMYLARSDTDVRELLRFLGHNGSNWVSLFATYEIVKREWKDKDIVALGLASEGELKRFTHTANNGEVLGPFARHAKSKQDPPKKPMTVHEAKSLVLKLARSFVRERGRKCGLPT